MALGAGGRHHKINLTQLEKFVRPVVSKRPISFLFWLLAGALHDNTSYLLGGAGQAGRFELYNQSYCNLPGSPVYRPELATTDNQYVPLHILAPRPFINPATPDSILDGVPIPDPIQALAAIVKQSAELAAESAIRAISIDSTDERHKPELVRRASTAICRDNDSPQPVIPPRREIPAIPAVDLLALNSLLAITTGHKVEPDPYLNVFAPPSPIEHCKMPRPHNTPGPHGNEQESGMVVFEESVVETHIQIKRAFLDYFRTMESFPLVTSDPSSDYRVLACRKMYAEVMMAIEMCLACAEEAEYTRRQ
ncbi:hypothetical protein PCANC_06669 [Puccinia coronata f. sp. avenae]|uniref:Uncharacterized protein n=1 Tax=Puccinia coronata f. sp. avenae TaxID=200324 RepID=A0A2N5VUE8_9BASI|nr:hypothetical protein PCANC_06669 [Puccinia coronata f. sp. avenae]